MLHGMVQLVNIMDTICGSYAEFLLHMMHHILGCLELPTMVHQAHIGMAGICQMKVQNVTRQMFVQSKNNRKDKIADACLDERTGVCFCCG